MSRIEIYTFARTGLIVVALVLSGVTVAEAEFLSPTLLEIEAVSDSGNATFSVPLSQAQEGDDVWTWSLDEPVQLLGNEEQLIGILESASLIYVEDPQIGLNFSVMAGNFNTAFTISSAVLGFPLLNPAIGRASAGVSVTDGSGNGATLSGDIGGGGKSYRAIYNGGTIFADLVSNGSTAGAFDTFTSNESSPAAGFSAIAGGVSSIQTEFAFSVNARDSASGTSVFVVQVPEPGSLALVLLGAMVLAGRRLRR